MMNRNELSEVTERHPTDILSKEDWSRQDLIDVENRMRELGVPLDKLIRAQELYQSGRKLIGRDLESSGERNLFLSSLYIHAWAHMQIQADLLTSFTAGVNEWLISVARAPIEAVRDEVRRDVEKLSKAFEDLSARLVTGIALKASLRKLENEAAKYDYEPLSRVAAVLHDTLKHNPIESFDKAEMRGFIEASKQATEGSANQSDPYVCEKTLIQVGLSWLPTLPEADISYIDGGETQE